MASYVIVGASRGLGYEWLRQLSKDSSNTVIGLVRSIETVQAKLDADSIKNVRLFTADMTDSDSLTKAAADVAKITQGVDYLIVNGAIQGTSTAPLQPSQFAGKEAALKQEATDSLDVLVLGVIYSINAFLSLVRKGSVKKVTVISSGMADTELVLNHKVPGSVIYASMKAATNMVVVKYAIELKEEGIVVFALSPGLVNTSQAQPTEEELKAIMAMLKSFQDAYPNFQGAISPEESVLAQRKVIEDVTLEQTGSFISHHGNKQWL